MSLVWYLDEFNIPVKPALIDACMREEIVLAVEVGFPHELKEMLLLLEQPLKGDCSRVAIS